MAKEKEIKQKSSTSITKQRKLDLELNDNNNQHSLFLNYIMTDLFSFSTGYQTILLSRETSQLHLSWLSKTELKIIPKSFC